jgi:muramoyltetrapeptide carboxypeptidase
MRRRAWLAAGAAALLGGCAVPGPMQSPPQPLVRPPRLREGDTIGLFGSGTRLTEAWIAQSVANIEGLGFRVKPGRHLRAVHGHYAGTVAQRVEDLHTLWADPSVRGLWSVRGGAGTANLLSHLDYALFRRDPKPVLGYSDLTALHLALQRHAGLVSFHTLAAVSTFTPYSVEALRAVLMAPRARTQLTLSPEHRRRAADEPPFRARAIRAGVAQGPLTGGNLSVLSALVGTPYGAQSRGALLFLEDVGELPYRVDRMLTQLQLAGLLSDAAGLIGGVFQDCEPPPGDPSAMPLAMAIDERLGSAGVPAVYGWSFGHVRDQLTLPLGVNAVMDTADESLTLLEPAVV